MSCKSAVFYHGRRRFCKSWRSNLLSAARRAIPSSCWQDQAYGTISDDTFGKYWCHFTAKIGDLDLFQILHSSPSIVVKDTASLQQTFEKLIAYRRSDALSAEFRVTGIIHEIIAEFIDGNASVKLNLATTPTYEKMNGVLRYMEQHMADQVSIETFGPARSLSSELFHQRVQTVYGLLPHSIYESPAF